MTARRRRHVSWAHRGTAPPARPPAPAAPRQVWRAHGVGVARLPAGHGAQQRPLVRLAGGRSREGCGRRCAAQLGAHWLACPTSSLELHHLNWPVGVCRTLHSTSSCTRARRPRCTRPPTRSAARWWRSSRTASGGCPTSTGTRWSAVSELGGAGAGLGRWEAMDGNFVSYRRSSKAVEL